MYRSSAALRGVFQRCIQALFRVGLWGGPGAALLMASFALASPPSPTSQLLLQVKRAEVIDLSHTWDERSPLLSFNSPFSMSVPFSHSGTRGMLEDNGQVSFASDVMQWSGQHGAPTIDALGHIGHNGMLYGGVDAAASTSDPRGLGRSGVGADLAIDHFPLELMANRGVLLDVASFINGNDAPLPPGFEITARHLRLTAAAQRVELRPGDTVFIRTGWGQYFKSDPALYQGEASPGPGVDAARYLVEKGARMVGADTLTFEKRPAIAYLPQLQLFPVHLLLLPDNGIYIIENVQLEHLSKARAYEFVAVVPPLKVLGGTGSALRAFALVAQPGR